MIEQNESDFWHQRDRNDKGKQDKDDDKRSSLKNNFMNEQEDDSLFNKFKKYKDSNPKLYEYKQAKPPLAGDDKSQERIRTKQAAKKLHENKSVLTYDEERKIAKDKKAKMDELKKKYTNISRSKSRKRSKSKGPQSCYTKINNVTQSEIQPKPSKIRHKHKIIHDNRTDVVQGRLRPGKYRKLSPGTTTKCTRDEDINIDQFLLDDLAFINKEEAKLQQEILNDHKETIMKVKAVERKHDIDTGIVNTRQMVKKLNDLDPYETMKKFDFKNETEDQIEESLENLNWLLAQNHKPHGDRKKAYRKIADKMNIRLESTSPVRAAPAHQQKGVMNPFAYDAKSNIANEYEVPNFKPRSMIGQNEDAISKNSKTKSVITAVGTKNPKLLTKEKNNSGSYLNSEALKVSILNLKL
jgi:hypothetical protein